MMTIPDPPGAPAPPPVPVPDFPGDVQLGDVPAYPQDPVLSRPFPPKTVSVKLFSDPSFDQPPPPPAILIPQTVTPYPPLVVEPAPPALLPR